MNAKETALLNELKCGEGLKSAEMVDELKRAEALSAEIAVELKRAQDEKVAQQVKQKVDEIMKKIQPGAVAVVPPSVSDGLGRLMWTLSCLTEEVRRRVNHLPTTEQNENLRLALRHLEDAHHRLDLARPANC